MPLTAPTVQQCVTLFRQAVSDLDTSLGGRWSDAVIINWIDRSNKRLVGDVLYPDSRILQPSVPGVQLYQFPLMLRTDRVYVAGQIAVPTDIPTLGGEQIGMYDQTSNGSTTSGPFSDAPTGTIGPAAPQWTVQTPLSYPVVPNLGGTTNEPSSDSALTSWFTPAPDAEPWYVGSQPRFYWRGGWLGVIPTPANVNPVVTICIDGVRQPDTLTSAQQPLTSPDNFVDAIVWGAMAWAQFGNDGSTADRQRQIAEEYYTREKRKLVQWRWGYQGMQRDGPKPSVLRLRYSGYHKRTTRAS